MMARNGAELAEPLVKMCLQHLICKMMARNGAELAQPLVKMNEYSAQHLADISETVDETNNQTPLTD